MLSPPTDKLYKFWAILGLALVGVGVPTALNAYDHGKQAELAFVRSFEPAQRAANRYFEEVNLLKAELRKYNNNPSKEAWDSFQKYQAAHEEALNKLQSTAETADDSNQSDLRTAEHARFMAWLWFGIGVALSCFGIACSFVGFRNWVKREA